jgi:cysteine desulfuration protein SufE
MSDETASPTLPPAIARVLARFRAMGREEKMQALVHYSKKLEPLPERFRELARDAYSVPECQTRVDLFPDERDGKLHFYADVNVRQSPTVAAFLAILFSSINDQPPAVTLSIPPDYVHQLMDGIGLSGREAGLSAMVSRVKAYARGAGDARPAA